ncbi:hypothetical protein PPROV_000618500 [Pycnococcus provasolii]|uniref:SUI1 domain-containing protein n=1 Tax=Pycnococcus provasolii TaxID=41880 RepID=A0A830HLB3_9CHLO|nr:hypothetical protein PPROV_000618500 [Pycnococcus provasolii]
MFKKGVKIKAESKLGEAHVKTLRRDLLESLPFLDETMLDNIMPRKTPIHIVKLSNRAFVFKAGAEGNPVFFDPEGRGVYLPTLYAIWKMPTGTVPAVCTYSEVSRKLLHGADLMMPGVVASDTLGEFKLGDVRAAYVCAPDGTRRHTQPFAVGTMETDSDTVAKNGLKGKGLRNIHVFGDLIWEMGDKSKPHVSFQKDRCFLEDDPSLPEEDPEPAAPAPAQSKQAAAAAESSDSSDSEDDDDDSEDEIDEVVDGVKAMSVKKELTIDEKVELALKRALLAVADGDLPIPSDKFFNDRMKPHLNELDADVKKSSYKKASKIFSTFEKKKWLSLKAIHKVENLVAVNRDAAPLQELMQEEGVLGSASGAASGAGGGESAAGGSAEGEGRGRVIISTHYKVGSMLRPIFGAAAQMDRDRTFSETDVRENLNNYLTQNQLWIDGGDRSKGCKIDDLLLDGLVNKKEKEEMADATFSLDEMISKLIAKLQALTHVRRFPPDGGEPLENTRKGQCKHVFIQVEDRHAGRKFITRISGMEYFAMEPEELANSLQKVYNASSSVAKLPGKQETGKEISIQGNLLTEAATYLRDVMGVPEQYIDRNDKRK